MLGLVGYVLLAAFGVGVWRSAAGSRNLRVVGGVLVVLSLASLWAVPYAAMQMPGTKQEGLHVALRVLRQTGGRLASRQFQTRAA